MERFFLQKLFSLLFVEMVNYLNCCPTLVPNYTFNTTAPYFLNEIPASSTPKQRKLYIQLNTWLNTQSEEYYNQIITKLLFSDTYSQGVTEARAFLATAPISLGVADSNSPRVLFTAPDGRVLFDSSKSDTLGTSSTDTANTYTNSATTLPKITVKPNQTSAPTSVSVVNPIGDNHNTRAAIMTSLLMQPTGLGYQTYLSTTVKKYQSYVAKRIGTQSEPAGVVRVSANINE